MMKADNLTVIETRDFVWQKNDGTTAPVPVMISAPYRKNMVGVVFVRYLALMGDVSLSH
jgi:hypothetical protein